MVSLRYLHNGFYAGFVQGKICLTSYIVIPYYSSQNPQPLQVTMDTWLQQSPIRVHLLLWMCLVLIWGGSIHPSTIALDTEWLVVNNPILSVHSWDSLYKIWCDFSVGTRLTLGAEYLPIRDLTVWFDWWVFGESWGGHHLHSLLWYGVSCSLLLNINQILFDKTTIVWLGTLIFLVHPIHVESVVWLASRKDVVSLTFVLLAIWLYLKHVSTWWIGIVALLAYWSKNTAIVLGPLLVLISICHSKEDLKDLKWWYKWIPIAIPLAVGLKLTLHIGSTVAMFAEPRGANALETFNIATQTWGQYMGMLLYPNALSLFYAEPTVQVWTDVSVLLGVGIALSILIVSVLSFHKNRMLTLALLTIPLGLLPVSQITPIQNLIADRYLLIPSIGLTWVLIQLFQQFQSNFSRASAICILWGLMLCGFTLERINVFTNEIRLWTDLTIKQPAEIRGWTTLASLYRDEGDLQSSLQTLQSADKHHPNNPKITLAYGMQALSTGDMQEAETYFRMAWQKDTGLREAGNNLAWVLQKSDPSAAKHIALELTAIHPLYATGWDTLGNSCMLEKDWLCAKSAFEKVLELEPYRVDTHANLGSLYYLQEDWEQAAFWWTKTLRLNPTHAYAKQGLDASKALITIDKPIEP